MTDTTKWILIGIAAVVIIGIVYFLYRKKKQYGFVFKMMKESKRQKKEFEEKKAKEEAFAAKQLEKSMSEAGNIIQALGGKENIVNIEQCAIRLRAYVEDAKKVNQKALKAAGVSGVIKTTKNIQLVVGDRAQQIHEEMIKELKI